MQHPRSSKLIRKANPTEYISWGEEGGKNGGAGWFAVQTWKKHQEKKGGCQNVPLSGNYAEYVPVGLGDILGASPPSCLRRCWWWCYCVGKTSTRRAHSKSTWRTRRNARNTWARASWRGPWRMPACCSETSSSCLQASESRQVPFNKLRLRLFDWSWSPVLLLQEI